jgi:phage-related tail protein
MQQIISFNENVLGGYNQTQLAQLANTWTENNLTPEKSTDIQNRITIVNDGLESLLNYANSINISNVGSAFAGIINSEKLKNQKVEIVNTWKANITQNLNYIETNVNTLKTTFTQARGLYNSIGQLNNNISAIQDKKSEINGVATCGSPNPLPC